jgi:hypothetical protein
LVAPDGGDVKVPRVRAGAAETLELNGDRGLGVRGELLELDEAMDAAAVELRDLWTWYHGVSRYGRAAVG